MSEVGNVDFAPLDGAVDASAVDNSAVDTEVETLETEASPEAGDNSETKQSSEASEQNTEAAGKTGAVASKDGAVAETAQSKAISQVLKSLVENDPNAKGAAKLLRDAYFGEQAFKKEFKSVADARSAKAFLSEVAGQQGPVTLEQAREAFSSTQAVLQNIEETDQLLYDGDGKVINNVWDDLKEKGKEESFFKIGSSYLDKMKEVDRDSYEAMMQPHFWGDMQHVRLPNAIQGLKEALDKNDTKTASTITKGIYDWMLGIKNDVEKKNQANSEQSKIQTERQKWESEKAQGEMKTFKVETATTLEKTNNVTLGKDLGTYLRMPFFKALPNTDGKGGHAPWKLDLGNGIKAELYKTLGEDKEYQRQMKALWGSKTPDKAKISQYHNDKLQEISADVVKRVIEARYPNYAKGGSAAGRVLAMNAKKEANAKTSAASIAQSKPVYVASKPKDLVRNDVVTDLSRPLSRRQ
jgi:hypothetical protein